MSPSNLLVESTRVVQVCSLVFLCGVLSACGVNGLTAHGKSPAPVALAAPPPPAPTPIFSPVSVRFSFVGSDGYPLNIASFDTVFAGSAEGGPEQNSIEFLAQRYSSQPASLRAYFYFEGLPNCPIEFFASSEIWKVDSQTNIVDTTMAANLSAYAKSVNKFVTTDFFEKQNLSSPGPQGFPALEACGTTFFLMLKRQAPTTESEQGGGQSQASPTPSPSSDK